jgi:hypothetical protein
MAIGCVWLSLLILCWAPVVTALNLGWNDSRYFQIVAAPFLVTFFMYCERNRIFPGAAWSTRVGVPLLAVALSTYLFLHRQSNNKDSVHLALAMAAVFFWRCPHLSSAMDYKVSRRRVFH